MKEIVLSVSIFIFSVNLFSQGSEMINNGSFDSSDDWTIISEGEWVISEGVAHFEDIDRGYLRQSASDMGVTIEDNTTYILTFDIIPDTMGGVARMRIYGDTHIPLYKKYDNYYEGTNQVVFTTPATGNNGGIEFYASTDEDGFSIDNVSLVRGDDPAGSPYFVALDGHDGNDGSKSSPFATPERAFMLAEPGDSIYIRAGTYYRTQAQGSINLSVADGTCNSGKEDSIIFLGGYPPDIANGDSVVFDFSLIMPEEPDYSGIEADPPTATQVTNNGFSFSWMNYFHLKDFTIRNVWQKYRYVQVRGMNFYACNYFTLENIHIRNVGGQGIFSSNGTIDTTRYLSANGDTILASMPAYTITDSTLFLPGDSTYIINCDGEHCVDSLAVTPYYYNRGMAGSWSQAFFFVLAFPGEYLEFEGCRAWECGDDGYNVVGAGTNRMKNCWSFNNGIYLPYIDYITPGQGFKLNSPTILNTINRIADYPDQISHYLTNCIASYNQGSGYSENSNGTVSLNRNIWNNISYKNGSIGFAIQTKDDFAWDHRDNQYINNISHDNDNIHISGYAETDITNSWNDSLGVTLTDDDFLALPNNSSHNSIILSAPRQSDGSLPEIGDYYKLSPNSDLVDAGTDVGLAFNGSAPDLGAFESNMEPETNNKYPSIVLTSPKSGSILKKTDDHIIISSEASDPDGSISMVEFFYNDNVKIGEAVSEPWSISWENVDVGTYSLRAVATDNEEATATTEWVSFTVLENFSPSISLTSPGNGDAFTEPAQIILNANASDPDGEIAKVEFFSGTAKIGEKNSSPWSFEWNNVPEGKYSLKAIATDNSGARTTSSIVNIIVNKQNVTPIIQLISPVNGSKFLAPANIEIIVEANDTDREIYNVEFFSDNVKLGETNIFPYNFNWNNVGVGSYKLTAVATDNMNERSTSTPINITVIPDIKLYPNPNNGEFTLSLSDSFQTNNEITIYSIDGRVVFKEQIFKDELIKTFNLAYLDSGTYIFTITGKDMFFKSHFVKLSE